MSEWVDATDNPQKFVDAVSQGKRVFANLSGGCSLQWDGKQMLYVFPHRGDRKVGVFPGMYKRGQELWEEAFCFYDAVHRELLRRELAAMKNW